MSTRLMRGAVASVIAIAIAGCTTTGIGTGQAIGQNLGAQFTWTENGGTRGTMIAQLSDGQVYQGPFFQITSEGRVDYDPLWNGWGGGFGWGRGWGGHRFGFGWGGWVHGVRTTAPSPNIAARCSPTFRVRRASCAATSTSCARRREWPAVVWVSASCPVAPSSIPSSRGARAGKQLVRPAWTERSIRAGRPVAGQRAFAPR